MRWTLDQRFDLIGAVPGRQGTAIKVLTCLVKRTNNDTGLSWPGRGEIARFVFGDDVKHHQDKVTEAIGYLEENSFIAVRRNSRKVASGKFVNVYELLPHRLRAPVERGEASVEGAQAPSLEGAVGHSPGGARTLRIVVGKQSSNRSMEQPVEPALPPIRSLSRRNIAGLFKLFVAKRGITLSEAMSDKQYWPRDPSTGALFQPDVQELFAHFEEDRSVLSLLVESLREIATVDEILGVLRPPGSSGSTDRESDADRRRTQGGSR